jgi:hypothetical protein
MSDRDCGKGAVCDCGGGSHGTNECLKGNCRTDKDCGKHGLCSPSTGEGPRGGCSHSGSAVVGYFCRTRKDTCIEDADCGERKSCVFVRKLGHWACAANHNCPVG